MDIDNLKIICINLKRREDRRESMIEKFEAEGITNYEFFEAVDGSAIDPNDERINIFKHSETCMLERRGALGCALSHYLVWKKLLDDSAHDRYLVLEDDINFGESDLMDNFDPDNEEAVERFGGYELAERVYHRRKNIRPFREELDEILSKINNDMHLVMLGSHVQLEDFMKSRKIYEYDTTYTIHLLKRRLYAGGAFAYIITKQAAQQLIEYIKYNGIKIAIDYVTYESDIDMYETHPHLIFSNAIQHSFHYVDSDIQRDYDAVKINLLENKYIFKDYVFFPNLDSPGNDIAEVYADIKNLKEIADEFDDCVAFNSYGWIKHTLVDIPDLIELPNKYYSIDGLYVKKSFLFRQ